MTSTMMATAEHQPPGDYDPDLYQRLISDRSTKWYLADVERAIGYGKAAVQKFRGRSREEGGAGPVALPEPDDYDPPIRGTAPRPWWYPGTIREHAITVGWMTPTGEPQRPLPFGPNCS